jgi:hypothetical protein
MLLMNTIKIGGYMMILNELANQVKRLRNPLCPEIRQRNPAYHCRPDRPNREKPERECGCRQRKSLCCGQGKERGILRIEVDRGGHPYARFHYLE